MQIVLKCCEIYAFISVNKPELLSDAMTMDAWHGIQAILNFFILKWSMFDMSMSNPAPRQKGLDVNWF